MVNWIISSTVLIIVIASLRFVLKGKISLRLQYALWFLVMVRLLFPFSIGETTISIGNLLNQVSQSEEVNNVYEISQIKLPSMTYEQAYIEVAEQYKSQGIDIHEVSDAEFALKVENEVLETMTSDITLVDIAMLIWGVGAVVVGFWFVITNTRFQRKMLASRKSLEMQNVNLPVYISDEVDTPCIFGLIHPAIYVTGEVAKDELAMRHVVAHETTHFIHKDHLWGYLRALCLAIHWYNPFVWYAASVSRNDAELACDEATIKRLGESERASYGRTLIDLTCEKRPEVLLVATTMSGSGKSIKERISLIVKQPKTAAVALVVVVLIAVIAMLSTFTSGKESGAKNEPEINVQATEGDDIVIEKLELTQFSDDEIELISKFMLSASGAAIAEGKFNVGDTWGGSSAELTDYAKSVLFYMLLEKYNFSGLDTFEETGLLEEVEGAYQLDAEEYVALMGLLFKDDMSDANNAMDFFADLKVLGGEKDVYEIKEYFESVYGSVTNLMITQMSKEMIAFDADVDSVIGLWGADFDVHMEAILNTESPLAGITITSIQVTCKEPRDYYEHTSNGYHIQYEDLSQDALVTDEIVIKNILQLILDEKVLMDVIDSECKTDDEQQIEVDGQIYYRVIEADNWAYFEEQAKQYYSESYLKDEFTGKYVDETKLYMEKDGKLYRSLADGVIGTLLEDTIEVWEIENGNYYVTIVENTIGGGDYLIGYKVQRTEDNKYGFEIIDKPLVFSQNQQSW